MEYILAHQTLFDPEVDAVDEELDDNLSIERKLTSTILQVCRVLDLHKLSALCLAWGMLSPQWPAHLFAGEQAAATSLPRSIGPLAHFL